MKKIIRITGSMLAFATLNAHAVVILHTTFVSNGGKINPPNLANVDQGYSAHKALSEQDQFKGVGEQDNFTSTLIGTDNAGNSYFLTAAHCYGESGTINDFSFTDWNGDTFDSTTAKVYKHPDYINDGPDIAIVKVPKLINVLGWTKPTLYSGTHELGKTITWVGYGIRGIGGLPEGTTGTVGQDDLLYDIGRAAGRNVIDSIQDGELIFDFDGPDTAVDAFEGHMSSGDSGGSGWIKVNGKWVIAGIVSTSDSPETYGKTNNMTRVSEVNKWISGIYSEAQFMVPEPSSISMLGVSGVILIFRRRPLRSSRSRTNGVIRCLGSTLDGNNVSFWSV